MKDWHGYSALGKTLHIGPLPGRKRIALYEIAGASIFPLAYFQDVDAAQRTLRLLDVIAGGNLKR